MSSFTWRIGVIFNPPSPTPITINIPWGWDARTKLGHLSSLKVSFNSKILLVFWVSALYINISVEHWKKKKRLTGVKHFSDCSIQQNRNRNLVFTLMIVITEAVCWQECICTFRIKANRALPWDNPKISILASSDQDLPGYLWLASESDQYQLSQGHLHPENNIK